MRATKQQAQAMAHRLKQEGVDVGAAEREIKAMSKSELEAEFINQWLAAAPPFPNPVAEYRFDARPHPRKWRFDFAWPEQKVAVEVEGRGHQKESRFYGDVEKYNEAALQGWLVIRVTRQQLDDLSGPEMAIRALRERGA